MSDTVLTALIAAGAALLGSSIGFLANVITSRQVRKQRLWEERHRAYAKLVECYDAYIMAPIKSEADSEEETAAYFEFRNAYCNAVLLCEKSTANFLINLFNQIQEHGNSYPPPPGYAPGYQSETALKAAVEAMKKELSFCL